MDPVPAGRGQDGQESAVRLIGCCAGLMVVIRLSAAFDTRSYRVATMRRYKGAMRAFHRLEAGENMVFQRFVHLCVPIGSAE